MRSTLEKQVALSAQRLGFFEHKRSTGSKVYRTIGEVYPLFSPRYVSRYQRGFSINAEIGVDVSPFEEIWAEKLTRGPVQDPWAESFLFSAYSVNFDPLMGAPDIPSVSDADAIDRWISHIVAVIRDLPTTLSDLRDFLLPGREFGGRSTSLFLAQRSEKSEAFRIWAREKGVSFDEVQFKEPPLGKASFGDVPLRARKITFDE